MLLIVIYVVVYGDYWRHLRKICSIELLITRRVKSLWPKRQKEYNSLLKKIASNEGSEGCIW